METCDKPVGEMVFCEATNCAWRKAGDAFSVVLHTPGAATMVDWAFVFATVFIVSYLLLFLLSPLTRRL
jgi:hypothetical protein